jgi:RNA polymerase sigma factor (sigma-70 family)
MTLSGDIPQTDWSMLGELGKPADARSRALAQLVRRYWPAIYAFIRRTGRDVHEAADLTQGFISTVMLERDLASRADPTRGRFRAFLLTSLRNYLRERHRHDARRSPRPVEGGPSRPAAPLSLDFDAADERAFATPEAAFSYQWSAALVRGVLERVRRECLRDGFELHWSVFDARVVRPMLFGEPPASMTELVERFELDDVSAASNMLVTVKRRVARALREEIASTVESESAVGDELASLRRDLEKRGE